MKKNCKHCTKVFNAAYKHKKYCSKACYQRSIYDKQHEIYEAGKKVLEWQEKQQHSSKKFILWPILGTIAVIGIIAWAILK